MENTIKEVTLDSTLLDKVKALAVQEFEQQLLLSNRTGELGEFLKNHNLDNSLQLYLGTTQEFLIKKPKIAVIGGDNASHQKEDIKRIFEEFGYNEDDYELFLGYYLWKKKKSIQEEFENKQDHYSIIYIGENPHKNKGIDNIISTMQKNRLKYPKVVPLDSGELKFTLSRLREELNKLQTDANHSNTAEAENILKLK